MNHISFFLLQLFFRVCVNIGELSDLLIQQAITSVVKVSDEFEHEDVEVDDVCYGVFSIVNLTAKKNMECIRQIHSLLLDKCKEVCAESDYGTFKNILEDMEKHVGLIISERLVNIPAQIAVPLYAGLSHDIKKYKALGQPFDFAYYIIISKLIVYDSGPVEDRVHYANPEEEIIAESAVMSFDYPVSNENDSGAWTDEGNEGRRKRRVMLIPASKYDEMYLKMVSEISQA
ncbi:protein BCCIP homolog isoform X2 [Stegodyphus dumicola]|uniref:protein BCCIP homolog isoform X2 n=1 Tax=Stegodyphus dumicola TaxID=202533 RepID=UPI0015B263B4|nr:protein BCCIP homolog isoform X2 [Stegodyphus dumicola]